MHILFFIALISVPVIALAIGFVIDGKLSDKRWKERTTVRINPPHFFEAHNTDPIRTYNSGAGAKAFESNQ